MPATRARRARSRPRRAAVRPRARMRPPGSARARGAARRLPRHPRQDRDGAAARSSPDRVREPRRSRADLPGDDPRRSPPRAERVTRASGFGWLFDAPADAVDDRFGNVGKPRGQQRCRLGVVGGRPARTQRPPCGSRAAADRCDPRVRRHSSTRRGGLRYIGPRGSSRPRTGSVDSRSTRRRRRCRRCRSATTNSVGSVAVRLLGEHARVGAGRVDRDASRRASANRVRPASPGPRAFGSTARNTRCPAIRCAPSAQVVALADGRDRAVCQSADPLQRVQGRRSEDAVGGEPRRCAGTGATPGRYQVRRCRPHDRRRSRARSIGVGDRRRRRPVACRPTGTRDARRDRRPLSTSAPHVSGPQIPSSVARAAVGSRGGPPRTRRRRRRRRERTSRGREPAAKITDRVAAVTDAEQRPRSHVSRRIRPAPRAAAPCPWHQRGAS